MDAILQKVVFLNKKSGIFFLFHQNYLFYMPIKLVYNSFYGIFFCYFCHFFTLWVSFITDFVHHDFLEGFNSSVITAYFSFITDFFPPKIKKTSKISTFTEDEWLRDIKINFQSILSWLLSGWNSKVFIFSLFFIAISFNLMFYTLFKVRKMQKSGPWKKNSPVSPILVLK